MIMHLLLNICRKYKQTLMQFFFYHLLGLKTMTFLHDHVKLLFIMFNISKFRMHFCALQVFMCVDGVFCTQSQSSFILSNNQYDNF